MAGGHGLELRGPEEHADDRIAVVAERCALQHAIRAAHLWRLALQRRRPAVKGLDEGHLEGARVVAGVADDREVVATRLATGERHVLRVDPDEVLRVADAGPAAVVEVPRGASAAAGR